MCEEREGSNLGGESQEVRDVAGGEGESESEREERGKREEGQENEGMCKSNIPLGSIAALEQKKCQD